MILENKDILFEDNHLLIVNKKAGILVQGDNTGDQTLTDLAKKYIKEKYRKPGNVFIGLAHRIDRPVSGVVILCKNSKSLTRVTQAFNTKEVKKIYWAIVSNIPLKVKGKLIHWLIKNSKFNKVRVFSEERKGALKCELDYELIFKAEGSFLMQISPLTGRPHQIRAQLSAYNLPVIGDVKYGYPQPSPDKSIYLHARSVELLHPVKKEIIKIVAPAPGTGLWKLFEKIEGNCI